MIFKMKRHSFKEFSFVQFFLFLIKTIKWFLITQQYLMKEQGQNSQAKRQRKSLKDKQRTKEEEDRLRLEQIEYLNNLIDLKKYRMKTKGLSKEQKSPIQIYLKSRREIKQQTVRKILMTLWPKKYKELLTISTDRDTSKKRKSLPTISTNWKAVQILLKKQLKMLFLWTSSKQSYKIKIIYGLMQLLQGKRRHGFVKRTASWIIKLGSEHQHRQQWHEIQKEVVQLIFQAQRLGRIAISFIQLVKVMLMLGKSDQKQLKSHEGTLITELLKLHEIYRDNFSLALRQPQFEQILNDYEKDKKDSIKNLITSQIPLSQVIQLFKAKQLEILKPDSHKSQCSLLSWINLEAETKNKNVQYLLPEKNENGNDSDESYRHLMSLNEFQYIVPLSGISLDLNDNSHQNQQNSKYFEDY